MGGRLGGEKKKGGGAEVKTEMETRLSLLYIGNRSMDGTIRK